MAKSLISPLLLELNNRVAKGRITPEQIQAFMMNPAIACGTKLPISMTEKLVGILKMPLEEFFEEGTRLSLVDGKPLYIRKMEDGERVVWGDTESKTYLIGISELSIVDGKLLYTAYENQGRLIVWGNEELFRVHTMVSSLTAVDGKLLYIARDDGTEFVVWGDKVFKKHESVQDLSIVDDKPLYIADASIVVWGDEEFKRYHKVKSLTVVERKPLYCAQHGDRRFVVWGDEEFASYTSVLIDKPSVVDGELLYVVIANYEWRSETQHVVWGSRALKLYDKIYSKPRVIDGKLFFAASIDDEFLVVWGDTKYMAPGSCSAVHAWDVVDGQPLYDVVLDESGKTVLVWGNRIYKGYDEIFSLTVTETEIVHGARKGKRILRVSIPRENATK